MRVFVEVIDQSVLDVVDIVGIFVFFLHLELIMNLAD